MSDLILLDGHVHMYPSADPVRLLDSAYRNLTRSAFGLGARNWQLGLLMTETHRDDMFSVLRSKSNLGHWRISRPEQDNTALMLHRADGALIWLFAGRQIITHERLEVLATVTRTQFADGMPIETLLAQLEAVGSPAILPWGLGKWMGTRGRVLSRLIQAETGPRFLLGDNAGRPVWGGRVPRLLRMGSARGIAVLPGTDPLPLLGTEGSVGSYGFALEGQLDDRQPGAALAHQLLQLRQQPMVFGRRRSALSVVREQIALRRRPALSEVQVVPDPGQGGL